MHKCVMSIAIAAGLCPAALAAEVRWINAAGGDWQDASNWEGNQLPGPLDHAVFDLSGDYAVSFSGHGTASSIYIPNGHVTFDAGEFSVLTNPADLDIAYLRIGSDSSTASLVLRSGSLYLEAMNGDGEVYVGTASRGSFFRVAEGARATDVYSLVAYSDSEVSIEGEFGLRGNGDFVVSASSSLIVAGVLGCDNFAEVHVRGRGEVTGDVVGNEASFVVEGHLDIRSGSHVRGMYFERGGGIVALEPSCEVRTSYIDEITLDLTQGDSSTVLYMGGREGGFWNTEFVVNSMHCDTPVRIVVGADDGWWLGFRNCTTLVSSTGSVSPGEMRPALQFQALYDPSNTDLSFVSSLEPPAAGIVRIGVDGPGVWGVYLLGVTPAWNQADLNFDGITNFFDIALLINAYADGSPWANTNNDFAINFFDIADYIDLYLAATSTP